MTGTFITFEGPDGAGKTSVLKTLIPQLEQHVRVPLHLTREPGGAKISETIREVILDPANTAMDARTEALLYAASRRQHLVEVIQPALAKATLLSVIDLSTVQLPIKVVVEKLGQMPF